MPRNVLLLDMAETVYSSTIAAAQLRAEEPAVRVLRIVRDHHALPFLEIASLTGMRISLLKELVKELESKDLVKLYGPDDPSNLVVGVSGSCR